MSCARCSKTSKSFRLSVTHSLNSRCLGSTELSRLPIHSAQTPVSVASPYSLRQHVKLRLLSAKRGRPSRMSTLMRALKVQKVCQFCYVHSSLRRPLLDRKDPGFGLDLGSQEGSQTGPRSANATPVFANTSIMGSEKARSSRVRTGIKRPHNEDEADDESGQEEEEARPIPKRNGSPKKSSQAYDSMIIDPEGGGADGEFDSKVYCTCRQVSYGEMIGCDDDDCDIEWVSHE